MSKMKKNSHTTLKNKPFLKQGVELTVRKRNFSSTEIENTRRELTEANAKINRRKKIDPVQLRRIIGIR